jgi:tripartite ATP-independent transporter DctP family solute receptor
VCFTIESFQRKEMKMKKTLLWIVAVVLSMSIVGTFTLAGCEKAAAEVEEAVEEAVEEVVEEVEEAVEEEEEEKVPAGTYTMSIGHSHSTTAPRHMSLLVFEQLVEKNSEGAIDVEIFPAGQLGTEAEMTESVKIGALTATRGGSFDIVATELSVYMMPFLFKDPADFVAIARGAIGDEIAANGLEEGVAILATGDAGGLRQWTNNVNPIETPDDIAGLKMRTPPIESIIKIMEAIGANPVSIPYAELYMALKTGLADGQENPLVNIGDKKFYEVQEYITMANYQIHPDPFFVNADWYDALEPYLQDVVVDAAEEMMKYSDQLMINAGDAYLPTIEENMEITYLDDTNRQAFIDMCQPVYDYFVDEGWFTAELLQKIQDELQ